MNFSLSMRIYGGRSEVAGRKFVRMSFLHDLTPALVIRSDYRTHGSGVSGVDQGRPTLSYPLPQTDSYSGSGTIAVTGDVRREAYQGFLNNLERFSAPATVTVDVPPQYWLSSNVDDDQGTPPYDFYGNASGYRWFAASISNPVPPTVYFSWKPTGDYVPEFYFTDVVGGSFQVFPGDFTSGVQTIQLKIGGTTLDLTPSFEGSLFHLDLPGEAWTTLRGAVQWNFITIPGYNFGFMPFTMGPLAGFLVDGKRFSTGTERTFTTEGTFVVDYGPSLDLDGELTSVRLCVQYYAGQVYSRIYLEDLATPVGEKQWQFEWDDIIDRLQSRGYFSTGTVPDNFYLPLTLFVTDSSGLTDAESAFLQRTVYLRTGVLVRPLSGAVLIRDKHVLWGHPPGQDRIWSGDPKTGLVESSDDEGAKWNTMAQAWDGITGAKAPFDYADLPGEGACSVAPVNGQILFQRSFDGIHWESPVPVCTAAGARWWSVASHAPNNSSTLTVIVNYASGNVRYDSEELGENGSWNKVDL